VRRDEDVLALLDEGEDLLVEVGEGAFGSELSVVAAHQSCQKVSAKRTSRLSPLGGGTSKLRRQMWTARH
jgi:hypothetical protein